MTPRKLKVGLIGTGFMGRAHVLGYAAAARTFETAAALELDCVADLTADAAAAAARAFGIPRSTGNWRSLVEDPEIAIVDVTAPTGLHRDMVLEAIAAGKHVYCEKPLAPTAAEALEMAEAAKRAGVTTQVGFNYLANPILRVARGMIAAGDLGEIYSYRGIHAEDYMADSAGPITFRHDPVGGGALGDIGSHALATAEFLLGPVAAVMGDCRTVIAERPGADGFPQQVEVDDVSRAFLRFESGVTGGIEANWCATGRTMQHDFEVYGSKGALVFSQERLNELHHFTVDAPTGRRGFRKIEAGPDHPPYGRFCVAPGHQLGFNDLKAIEIAGFAAALAGEVPEPFGFRSGHRIQRLVELIQDSASLGQWVDV